MKFCVSRVFHRITDAELATKLDELNNLNVSQFSVNEFRKLKSDKELKLITEIIYRSSQFQLQSQNCYKLITCTIEILIKYAKIPLYFSSLALKRKCNRRYLKAKANYDKLLKLFKAETQGEIINIVINTIHKEKFWHVRRVCVFLIRTLFDYGYNGILVYHKICNKIEFYETSEDTKIKFIVKVLHDLLDAYNWLETEETVIFLKRFLNLYYNSLYDTSEKSEKSFFFKLRSNLELCVKHIIQNVSNNHLLIIIQHMSSWTTDVNINDTIILNYSSTLVYAAYMYKEDFLYNTLTFGVFSLLMHMIKSSVPFVSLLGNRVLQHLIDRGNNFKLFNTPKIFFEDVKLKIKVNKYYKENEKFLMTHREIIHDSLIKSFINHRYNRLNIETTYCTICLLAIEVPCGFTAAALSCLMMNLQERIQKEPDHLGKKEFYHIHAIIISVLSFICWIHNAKDFHMYVNKVVMERAQWAPHLNPPIQSYYNFAEHHVLWNKPELFLIDWEVRYGLWKRFRLNESTKSIN